MHATINRHRGIDDVPQTSNEPVELKLKGVDQQTGSALLSVLLLFALVMLIVTQVMAVNRKAIEKTEYLFDGIKARQLLPFAESLAGQRLAHHLSRYGFDGGAPQSGGLGVGQGWSVRYKFVDLQSKINLNNVVWDAGWRPVIENLIQKDKKKIASKLIDWLDEDSSKVDIHGAEKQKYQQQLRKRMIANRPMVHPSEFRHLFEIEDEVWFAIRDKVVALPSKSTVNLNSASSETLDLMLVAYTSYPLLTGKASDYTSGEDFLQSPTMAGHNLVDNNHIDVKSQYWLFDITVNSPRRKYKFHSRVWLDSSNGQLRITDRFSGNYIAD